jgi:hypothetical protein
MHACIWWENLKERDTWKNLGVDDRVILKLVSTKQRGITVAGFMWLR